MTTLKDARTIVQPKYLFHRTNFAISLMRDNILLRITPSQMKFQLDRLRDEPSCQVTKDFTDIQRQSVFTKTVYGVFGYIKLKKVSYLILIEEASIVGQIMRGTVYRVDKLMFVPLYLTSEMHVDPEDTEYVNMINKI